MNFLEEDRSFPYNRQERKMIEVQVRLLVCWENLREFSRANSIFFLKREIKSFAVFLLRVRKEMMRLELGGL